MAAPASVQRAKDELSLIDEGAGHLLRNFRQQEERKARDVIRGEQAPERHRRRGVGEPSLSLAEGYRLHMPLRRGVDPADVDAVDANAVEAMGVRRVFGQPRERSL